MNAYSINRLFFVMKKRCVSCQAVTGFLNVTKKLLDVESVSTLPFGSEVIAAAP
jgi:hypothetical protein